MKVIYCAGPYRASNAWDVEKNIRRAEELGFQVAEAGAFPAIPHTNCRFWNGTLTDQWWLDATMSLMRVCHGVIFTDDYARSTGACLEEKEALRLGIPTFHSLVSLKAWLKENP